MMPAVLCAALLHYLRSKKPIITSRGASDSLTSRALGVHKRERNLCTTAQLALQPTRLALPPHCNSQDQLLVTPAQDTHTHTEENTALPSAVGSPISIWEHAESDQSASRGLSLQQYPHWLASPGSQEVKPAALLTTEQCMWNIFTWLLLFYF